MSSPDFLGTPIIVSEFMGEPCTRVVDRSWRERLFTCPWHPFKKTKRESYMKDDGKIIDYKGAYYCHPDTAKEIKENGMLTKDFNNNVIKIPTEKTKWN